MEMKVGNISPSSQKNDCHSRCTSHWRSHYMHWTARAHYCYSCYGDKQGAGLNSTGLDTSCQRTSSS